VSTDIVDLSCTSCRPLTKHRILRLGLSGRRGPLPAVRLGDIPPQDRTRRYVPAHSAVWSSVTAGLAPAGKERREAYLCRYNRLPSDV